MIVPNFQISAKFPEQYQQSQEQSQNEESMPQPEQLPIADSSKKIRDQNEQYDSDYEYSSTK